MLLIDHHERANLLHAKNDISITKVTHGRWCCTVKVACVVMSTGKPGVILG